MKKIFLFIVAAALIVAGSIALTSCQKDDIGGIDEFAASLTPICISEIPEGVVPIEFRNMREAKAFLEKLQREREKNPLTVQVVPLGEQEQFELPSAPRLRSATFEYGLNLVHSIDFLVDLDVFLGYDYIGGRITLTSSTSGVPLGFVWEQTSATARWTSGYCITYSVSGNESLFIGIGGVGFNVFVMRHSFSGTVCP